MIDWLIDRLPLVRMTNTRSPSCDEAVHLAADVHLIEPGVRARVGRHDQTFVGHDPQAVSHSSSRRQAMVDNTVNAGRTSYTPGSGAAASLARTAAGCSNASGRRRIGGVGAAAGGTDPGPTHEYGYSYADSTWLRHSLRHLATGADRRAALGAPVPARTTLQGPDRVSVEPGVRTEEYVDSFGNICTRLLAPPGHAPADQLHAHRGFRPARPGQPRRRARCRSRSCRRRPCGS